MRYIYFLMLFVLTGMACRKNGGEGNSMFYGYWKTSYGDTIRFFRQGGRDVVTYDRAMNPSMPMRSTSEYNYANEKLGIKDGFAGPVQFRYFTTFVWLQPRKTFEVQGVEWFGFISSTSTKFTFTKLP